jgi:hypothetical protein
VNLTIKSLTAPTKALPKRNQAQPNATKAQPNAMAAQSTRDTTTVLRDHTDWTTWISQLQSRCIVYNIWDKIDPESTAALLPKPAIPEPPRPAEYTPAANVLNATRVSELSTAGIKAYKEDLEHYKLLDGYYKNNLSEYQAEAKGVQHIVTFIQSTVTPHLQRTCCQPSLSLREWITNLSNTTGADTKLESKQARARYHAALRPLTRVPAWDTWLAEYDQAATEAETYLIVDVSHITAVVEDFLQAVQKAAPVWVVIFHTKEGQVTRKEMMKQFREHMMTTHPLRFKHKAAFVIDEASYLADGGATTQGNERDASIAETAPSRRAKPRNQPGNNPRKRAQEDRPSQGGAKCPACEQRHSINDCWYINTEQAPEWWKANKHVESLVEIKKKHDATLIGALRGQSRARSQSLHIKKSQTPTPTIQELEEEQ